MWARAYKQGREQEGESKEKCLHARRKKVSVSRRLQKTASVHSAVATTARTAHHLLVSELWCGTAKPPSRPA